MHIDESKLLHIFETAIYGDDDEPVTQQQLTSLESYLDRLFKSSGIDINFTRHFLDRINDVRNERQITAIELSDLFRKAYEKFNQGKSISRLGPDAQAVLSDMETDINVPFVLNWDQRNRELDLVAKTVMRKRGFQSSGPKFQV